MNSKRDFNFQIKADDENRIVITQFSPNASTIILPLDAIGDFIKLVNKAAEEASVRSSLKGEMPKH